MERLKASFKQNQINDLELQFNDFLNKYLPDKGFKTVVEGPSLCKTFAEEWSEQPSRNKSTVESY
jgi:hypothetical protein